MNEFRADQVGSLLRPPELLRAWDRLFAGQIEPAALAEIEDRAILDALDRQRRTGIDVFTDGEFRRLVYLNCFVDAVDGMALGAGPKLVWRTDPGREVPAEMANFRTAAVVDKLRPKGRIAGKESAFLREHAPGPVKLTLPSPAHFVSRGYQPGSSDLAYPDPAELARDVEAILAAEAADLAAEGVGYIQVDSPTYSIWFDLDHLEQQRAWGMQSDDLLNEMIAGDNAVLDAARVGGALTAVHICRGNASGAWLATGGYEPVAEQLFGELRCDRLLLEYDSDRAGGFEPLRLVPAPKTVVLGLVSTKYGALETRADLMRRIDEAARYVPLDRLAISPQCGFASNFRGNPLSEDEQWRKLELVASVADEVWS